MTIEVIGLELFGYHGVLESERRDGQRFLVDLWLEVGETAGSSDRLEDSVDYRELVDCARAISEAHAFALLEALATAIADAIVTRFPVVAVRVRVRKPDVLLSVPVEHAAVIVERRGGATSS